MSDVDLLALVRKEINDNPNPPVLDIAFDPFDKLAVELLYVQAEALIENHLEPYREKYRSQFEDPSLFDEIVTYHKTRINDQIRQLVADCREQAKEMGYDCTEYDSSENGFVN
jgi:hypothetical protein